MGARPAKSKDPESGEKTLVVYGAMAANVAIAVTKFAAAFVSGSTAMFSEGIHSTVDTANQVLLLVGIHRSQKPPDAEHPFGHGKERYFWSLIAAIVIFGVGGGVSVYQGVAHLRHPDPLEDPFWAYLVLVVAFVFEATSWTLAFRQLRPSLRRGKGLTGSTDPVVITVLFEDSAALLGLLIAAAGIALSHELHTSAPDAAASVLIGGLLAVVAIFLARKSRGLLVGQAADPEVVEDIRAIAEAHPDVHHVGDPLTMHFGPEDVLVNLALRFRRGLSSRRVARIVARLESAIRRLHPQVTSIYVEAETPEVPAGSVEEPEDVRASRSTR